MDDDGDAGKKSFIQNNLKVVFHEMLIFSEIWAKNYLFQVIPKNVFFWKYMFGCMDKKHYFPRNVDTYGDAGKKSKQSCFSRNGDMSKKRLFPSDTKKRLFLEI